MLQEEHHEDFWFVAMPHLTLPLFRGYVWQEAVSWCARRPSGYAGWPRLRGEGKGTAGLCWGSTTWMEHAWKILTHRSVISSSEIKGIFYESNTFQHYTCKQGGGQRACECIVCLNALFYIYRIKCLLLMQCIITDLGTKLSGCEPQSGGVICFGILLWFSLLLKDFFFFVYTVFQREAQGTEVELQQLGWFKDKRETRFVKKQKIFCQIK